MNPRSLAPEPQSQLLVYANRTVQKNTWRKDVGGGWGMVLKYWGVGLKEASDMFLVFGFKILLQELFMCYFQIEQCFCKIKPEPGRL